MYNDNIALLFINLYLKKIRSLTLHNLCQWNYRIVDGTNQLRIRTGMTGTCGGPSCAELGYSFFAMIILRISL